MSRVNIQQRQPKAYHAMFGLEKYLASCDLEPGLQEIVRIRASSINGCQYCLTMHSEAALKLGVSGQKLAAIKAGQGSDLFTEQEQAALKLTDSLTHVSADGLPEAVYQQAAELFDQDQLAQLIILVATINAWNRIAVASMG